MSTLPFAAALTLCALLLTSAFASEAQSFEKVKQETNRAGDAVFDYDELTGKGPGRWGDLSPDFDMCNKGHHQSPINLVTGTATSDGLMPSVNISESIVKYAPSGKNFVLNCAGTTGSSHCSTITFNRERYHMLQAHFHSPSEHHIDGKDFPLELHLVHQSENEKSLLVLGILFEIGSPNEQIQNLLDVAKAQGSGVVDFPNFVQPGAGLCTYEGSLTTPPCTEGVHWLLSNIHPQVNLRQVGEYREMVGEIVNARPVQPVSDPTSKCYLNPEFTGGIPHSPGASFDTRPSSTASSSSSATAEASSHGGTTADASSHGGTTPDSKTAATAETTDSSKLATPKPPPLTPAASGANSGSCFPHDALVTLQGSGPVPISSLRIGDMVSVGNGAYSQVFAFSHRDPNAIGQHVEFTLASGRKLTMTAGHHLHANGKYVAAQDVRVGDVLVGASGDAETVSQIGSVRATGLYNPHTLTGTIAVNGVVCSTYTTAMKSTAAQALLAPLRTLFRVGVFTELSGGQFLARGAESLKL